MQLAQVDLSKEWKPAQGTDFQTLGGFISSFLPKALIFAGVIFFVMTVFAGLGVLMSAGNPDPHTKEKAKGFFTNAIIGLAIIFASYWIVQLINFITFNSIGDIIQ